LSGAVGGADADVTADGVLIDFESAKGRSLAGAKEIYQLIGYALLDSDDEYKITGVDSGFALAESLDDWAGRSACPAFRQRSLDAWRAVFAEALGQDAQ
jgi:hypothetical protein